MGPFRLVFNVIFVDVICKYINVMFICNLIFGWCVISMGPFRFAFNHLSWGPAGGWGRFGQHHESWGRFGEAVSACPSFSEAVMVGAVSAEAISGGAVLVRSRPNHITGPGPKSGPAGKSESRGPENGVSRWRRPNSDIYSQNHHFGLVYDVI